MSYDESLAQRVRDAVSSLADVEEKKMFGGLAFLRQGKMFCGIVGDELMARIGVDAAKAALARPHVRPMDFTGRPMVGYVFVGAAETRTVPAVAAWAERAAEYVASLPEAKARSRRSRVSRLRRSPGTP